MTDAPAPPTVEPKPELLTVTQEDREAAADVAVRGFDYRRGSVAVSRMVSGDADRTPIVQAFARHRLDTRPTPAAVGDVEGLRELSERAAAGPWALYTTLGGEVWLARLDKNGEPLQNVTRLEDAGAASQLIVAAVNHARAALATRPAAIEPGGVGQGYIDAFYDLAKLMGLAAQPCSPKEIWEQEMRPRLVAALSAQPSDEVREALRCAISHIEHMAAWISSQQVGTPPRGLYSFESLGEDMPGIQAALSTLDQGGGR